MIRLRWLIQRGAIPWLIPWKYSVYLIEHPLRYRVFNKFFTKTLLRVLAILWPRKNKKDKKNCFSSWEHLAYIEFPNIESPTKEFNGLLARCASLHDDLQFCPIYILLMDIFYIFHFIPYKLLSYLLCQRKWKRNVSPISLSMRTSNLKSLSLRREIHSPPMFTFFGFGM